MDKTCAGCSQTLPAGPGESFGIDRKRPDGLHPYCKTCKSAKSKLSYAANREKYKITRAAWWKRKAPELKPIRAQYQKDHLEEVRERSQKWRETHREQVNAASAASIKLARAKDPQRYKDYSTKNYRKHRDANLIGVHTWRSGGGDLSVEQWNWMLDICGKRCQKCGIHESELPAFYPKRLARLEADHIRPISLEGTTTLANMQPLCPKCNNWKRSKVIDYRSTDVLQAIAERLKQLN